MKKRMVALFFSMIFALVLGTSGAFAEEATMSDEVAKALEEIDQTNAKIYEEIEKARVKSHELYDQKLADLQVEKDESKIEVIEANYEEAVAKLLSDLDVKTQDMTQKGVIKAADKAGITVEIEWILVQFADREKWIDPMRAVGW